jgi:hypothetical protein
MKLQPRMLWHEQINRFDTWIFHGYPSSLMFYRIMLYHVISISLSIVNHGSQHPMFAVIIPEIAPW